MRITIEANGQRLLEIAPDQTIGALPRTESERAVCLEALSDAMIVLAGLSRGGQGRGARVS